MHPGMGWGAGAGVAPPDAQGANNLRESASRKNNRSSNSGAATTDIQVNYVSIYKIFRGCHGSVDGGAVVLETHVRIARSHCPSPAPISLLIHVQRVHKL